MTKEEVIAIINEGIEDNEKAVKVLEAFDDYVKENDMSGMQAKLDEMTAARDEILTRYRERFSAGNTVDEPDQGSEVEEEKEEEVIDITELS